VILDEVSEELNRVYSLFERHTRSFSGKVSIAAHSLGGVICFDLLANQESVRTFVRAYVYVCMCVM
jgi:alpha-beta hydrolase superfamily lysophospholipase